MSNKILKSKKVAQLSVVIPDLSPIENPEFIFAFEDSKKKEIEEIPLQKL